VLAALPAVVDATQAIRPISTADAKAQRAGMDSARCTLQAMRLDENRLLAERVQVDQAACAVFRPSSTPGCRHAAAGKRESGSTG
jgi:hypothetical protein